MLVIAGVSKDVNECESLGVKDSVLDILKCLTFSLLSAVRRLQLLIDLILVTFCMRKLEFLLACD